MEAGERDDYLHKLQTDPGFLLGFLADNNPAQWDEFVSHYGIHGNNTAEKIANALNLLKTSSPDHRKKMLSDMASFPYIANAKNYTGNLYDVEQLPTGKFSWDDLGSLIPGLVTSLENYFLPKSSDTSNSGNSNSSSDLAAVLAAQAAQNKAAQDASDKKFSQVLTYIGIGFGVFIFLILILVFISSFKTKKAA